MKTVGVRQEQEQADPSACTELPAFTPEAAAEDKVGTRNRVARLILANGASTAADLAVRLEADDVAFRIVGGVDEAVDAAHSPSMEVIANYTAFQQIRTVLGRTD